MTFTKVISRYLLFFAAFVFLPITLRAQMVPFPKTPLPDSVVKLHTQRDTVQRIKHPKRAVIFFLVDEFTPFLYDRYVANKDYAKISFKTVGHNLNPGSWEWDNDPFQTNQFGHPYHGSYFFSSFRANGYSFWQSVPAAFAGSYLWETFAENQAPAPNDFINTSFGGIVLGETTYRLSNKIIDNRARGFKRQMDEVLAFLINPMNGLTRIMDGKWGKYSANPAQKDSTKIRAQFQAGYRAFNVNQNNPFVGGSGGWYVHGQLIYGTPDEGYSKPFTNIAVNIEVGKDDSTALNIVSMYGSLTGWDLHVGHKSQQLLILSANYDYLHNAAFFYGGQSVKFNLFSRYKIDDGLIINTALGAGAIILSAVPDPYIYKGRNYDYGPGFSFNGGGTITVDNKLFFSANYRGAKTFTINGNDSHYFLHNVSSELSYMFIKNLELCGEVGYIRLQGNYKKYPDVDRSYPYLKSSLRYTMNF